MMKQDSLSVALVKKDIEYIKNQLSEIHKKVESNFVSNTEFNERIEYIEDKIKPLQTILYGIVSLILTGVFGAVLSLVIKK